MIDRWLARYFNWVAYRLLLDMFLRIANKMGDEMKAGAIESPQAIPHNRPS